MPGGRPPFSPGDKAISTGWLNDVESGRRQVQQLTGPELSLFADTPRPLVIITRKPVEADTFLRVRRVKYSSMPPRECEADVCHYAFSSVEVPAYPDPPNKVMDFADLAETDPTLDDEAHYLYARVEAGTLRLEKPAGGGGTNLKVVRALLIVPENPDLVRVEPQRPKVNADTGTFEGWERDGEPGTTMDVFVWPGLNDVDYRPMILAGTKPYAKIEQYGGLWFLRQFWPWRVRTQTPAGLPSGRCNPI